MTLRGRIFLALFFALCGMASMWVGAWALYAIPLNSWMEFPIYMTALWVIVASGFGIVWVASL